jgi:ribosomal-protein-alanine N-acetyltransferase
MNQLSPQPQIRPMISADLDQVLAIEQSLPQAPHWPRLSYIAALDPLASPTRLVLVAEDPGSHLVTAFAVASLLPPQAELELIAVAPEAQRRGLARFLFAELAKELRSRQITEVILEVRVSNHPALGLYRLLGFTETACRPRYYADPVEDAALLSLRLL